MHPPLFRPHPKCEEFAKALIDCHAEKPLAKWFGGCNEVKTAMDQCFRLEKEEKRRENMLKARKFEDEFEEFLERKTAMQKASLEDVKPK